jgi:hypothetical protein
MEGTKDNMIKLQASTEELVKKIQDPQDLNEALLAVTVERIAKELAHNADVQIIEIFQRLKDESQKQL